MNRDRGLLLDDRRLSPENLPVEEKNNKRFILLQKHMKKMDLIRTYDNKEKFGRNL